MLEIRTEDFARQKGTSRSNSKEVTRETGLLPVLISKVSMSEDFQKAGTSQHIANSKKSSCSWRGLKCIGLCQSRQKASASRFLSWMSTAFPSQCFTSIFIRVLHRFPTLGSISQSASPYVCAEQQLRDEENEEEEEDYNLLMLSRETPS